MAPVRYYARLQTNPADVDPANMRDWFAVRRCKKASKGALQRIWRNIPEIKARGEASVYVKEHFVNEKWDIYHLVTLAWNTKEAQ